METDKVNRVNITSENGFWNSTMVSVDGKAVAYQKASIVIEVGKRTIVTLELSDTALQFEADMKKVNEYALDPERNENVKGIMRARKEKAAKAVG